jgi:hypothetical protein
MNKRTATRFDESTGSQQRDLRSKERLDDWLDDALADTFPASDPVASPPTGAVPDDSAREPNRSSAGEPAPRPRP